MVPSTFENSNRRRAVKLSFSKRGLVLRVVILNNPDDIREAFSKPEFSGRYGYNGFLDKQAEDSNNGLKIKY